MTVRRLFFGRHRVRNGLLFVGIIVLLAGTVLILLMTRFSAERTTERPTAHPGASVSPQPTVDTYQLVRDVDRGVPLSRADVQPLRLPDHPNAPSVRMSLTDIEGKHVKLALRAGAVLNQELLTAQVPPTDDVRLCEFAHIELPVSLQKGDAVDVRLKTADGHDWVVLAQKKVLQNEAQLIMLALNEAEILRMSAAETDVTLRQAKLYALRYVDPLLQAPATVTYSQRERQHEANPTSRPLPEN
jgi:hypothetical protein